MSSFDILPVSVLSFDIPSCWCVILDLINIIPVLKCLILWYPSYQCVILWYPSYWCVILWYPLYWCVIIRYYFLLVCHPCQCVIHLIFLPIGVSCIGIYLHFMSVCHPMIFLPVSVSSFDILYIGVLSFDICLSRSVFYLLIFISGRCALLFDSSFFMSVSYFIIFLPVGGFLNCF